MLTDERCPICDRPLASDIRPWSQAPWGGRLRAMVTTGECARHLDPRCSLSTSASDDCRNHAVDWRARCLTAEAERDEAMLRHVADASYFRHNPGGSMEYWFPRLYPKHAERLIREREGA